ncbi:hypothetical protein LTR27_001625 [Elasticomyces elasticus]|nr:hypothetical protein LTR27_001625 [Elasticomyces elasticus]
MASTTGPTLLTIPPEMRNRIYREALVKGRKDKSCVFPFFSIPDEPALLSIRKEALSIYYCEHRFAFGVYDRKTGKDQYFQRCLSDFPNTVTDVGTFREQLVSARHFCERHNDTLLHKFRNDGRQG